MDNFDLELFGLPVSVLYGETTGGITIIVPFNAKTSIAEVRELLLQMAASHAHMQSRFTKDVSTPNFWESKWDEVLP